ncbi:MAG: cytochrome d ubiquinol oxidase subunit II [Holophaga sp.]|nr:cytochrome d ubiquinol oxidase subunit II [Holophaga sp.]
MFETIWFIIWGVAWAVYFMLDGFDLGLGTVFPFLARQETDKRVVINAMGPFWDGNEVWLITAGGVTFAAFPRAYAVMFSGLYTPLMLLLFALILRGVAFEFRGKVDSAGWRRTWDGCLVFGSFLPALLLGVAFANIFMGLPIDAVGIFHGNLLTLLNPYGLVGGLTFVLVFAVHGLLWLATRCEGALLIRAGAMARRLWLAEAVLAVLFLAMTWFSTPLWQNVLAKPWLLPLPLLAVAGLLGARVWMGRGAWWKAWLASSALILGTVLFGVAGLFPNLLPSRLAPAASLTAFNSASSPLTLKIMLGVVLCCLPVVIGYQLWVYLTFRDPVNAASIAKGPAY